MEFNIKAIVTVAAPITIVVAGAGLFMFLYFPEWHRYKQVKDKNQILMERLEKYQSSPENGAVRGAVSYLERESGKLKEENQAIQAYLGEKYQFAYVRKYNKLSGLDFKNLIVEKRKELNRNQIGFEKYDSTIPKPGEISDLVKRLEISESLIKILQSMGVKSYDDIQVAAGAVVKNAMTQTDVYEEFAATFRVTASYEKLQDLLYALEHARIYMVVSYCKISGTSKNEVSADMIVKAIRFLFKAQS